MIKRLFLLALTIALVTSCGNSGKKESSVKSEGANPALKVEFASLVANPDNYIGKTIIIEGKVVHVCTETGKKMFLTGENPDVRLYVAAGENISRFPMELLGSEISVEGVITRKPLAGAGNEMNMEKNQTAMTGDSCETEKAVAGQPSISDIIMEYKSHTVKQ